MYLVLLLIISLVAVNAFSVASTRAYVSSSGVSELKASVELG